MRDVNGIDNNLSSHGIRRREAILRMAIGEASRRRVRRQVGRVSGSVVALLLAGAVALAVGRHPPRPAQKTYVTPLPPPVHREVAPAPRVWPAAAPKQRSTEIVITRIATDPTLADRLAVPRQAPTWKKLTDEELLRQLADAGRPAGLAYVQGHAILLPRDPSMR